MDPAQSESPDGPSPVDPRRSDSPPAEGGNDDNPGPRKGPARKRTKTGCLTCRKRRIKCDEGKPTCNNCIKSKRHCEGYTQRLTFKEPLNAYQHASIFGHHPVFGAPAPQIVQMPLPQPPPPLAKMPSPPGPLPVIAPKPPSADFAAGMPYQTYQVPPGSLSSTQSPPAFHPQHQVNQPSFLLSPESSSHIVNPQFPPQDLYNAISPTYIADNNANFGQISPVSDRWAPQTIRQTSLPTPVEEKHQLMSANPGGVVYWHSDDEASMGESDDEETFDDGAIAANLETNELGIQVVRHMPVAMDIHGTQMRTFTGFVNENILDTYYPSSSNSPLNDAQTASIFWYFVNVTAPSMSLYERHPFDSTSLFQGQPVPKSHQHIWTYTFPIIAFNHPGLLQAILALGSLQMAKLHGQPPSASMKHYHLSLRRLAKNYQSTNKRTQPATLAATLLLGFYEVWNSDHDKWCKHMWGARAIIKEIPLKQMTKQILALKRRRRQTMPELGRNSLVYTQPESPGIDVVNVALLSQLTGRSVSYDDFGHVYNIRHPQQQYTERDIETFEHLSDLYWWYCKMDVYQSILGGAKLFMDYDLWTQCTPRAPCGRMDAIYGTFDHLILVLGRMANFASRDLARKRKARKADPNAPRGPAGPGQSPPMFPGLVPANAHVAVPTGFSPPRDPSPPLSDVIDDLDLEASTAAALQEWDSIRQAFEIFRAQLGPDFDPLAPDLAFLEETPFGPSKVFRTYSIAGIWMNYYMGLIALYRAHPSMPPVAMMAAGMSAKQTMPWALEIARIAAGVHEDLDGVPAVSTLQGAALIESSLCLFVCSVQFQSLDQRQWTIKRLHNIARLTGWQSARQIADGCESAWTKAAAMGRGPPYQRPPELEKQYPSSVWANPRRIDRRIREINGENCVVLAKTERAHYALGLLAMEQDMDRLVLQDGPD